MVDAKTSDEVDKQNIINARQNDDLKKKNDLKVGDDVAIARNKGKFEKGTSKRWEKTLHKIEEIDDKQKPLVFRLHGLKGIFYRQQLQPVKK